MIKNDRSSGEYKTSASVTHEKKVCSTTTCVALAAIALTVVFQAALFCSSRYSNFSTMWASYHVSYATLFVNGTLLVTILPVALCAQAKMTKPMLHVKETFAVKKTSFITIGSTHVESPKQTLPEVVETNSEPAIDFTEPSKELIEQQLLKRLPEGLDVGEYVHFDFQHQNETVLVFAINSNHDHTEAEYEIFFGKGKDQTTLLKECIKWHQKHLSTFRLEQLTNVGEMIHDLQIRSFQIAVHSETGECLNEKQFHSFSFNEICMIAYIQNKKFHLKRFASEIECENYCQKTKTIGQGYTDLVFEFAPKQIENMMSAESFQKLNASDLSEKTFFTHVFNWEETEFSDNKAKPICVVKQAGCPLRFIHDMDCSKGLVSFLENNGWKNVSEKYDLPKTIRYEDSAVRKIDLIAFESFEYAGQDWDFYLIKDPDLE